MDSNIHDLLTEAKELSKNLDALQSEVDSMLQALNSLKESLVLKISSLFF